MRVYTFPNPLATLRYVIGTIREMIGGRVA
jgi:hypothetical protein